MSVIPKCRRAAWSCAAWGAIAALMAVAAPLRAEPADNVTMQVTPEAGRLMVAQAMSTGNADLAARIARQLIEANPNDVEAQVMLTAALSRSGKGLEAIETGKKAFRTAQNRPLKFQAAFLTAEALAGQNKPGAAKWWLRRADSYRSLPTDLALLQRGFASLDRRTPLKFTLTVGAGPSNNVNGGSLHDTFDFYGIPIPIEQALPGYTAIAVGQLSYRLQDTAKSSVSGFVQMRHREVWLSDHAQKLEPFARNSDFSSQGMDIGVSGQRRLGTTSALSYSGQVGRQWYDGGRSSEVQRLQFGFAKLVSETKVARLNLTAEAIQQPGSPRLNTTRIAADASLAVPIAKGRVTGMFGIAQLDAEAPGLPYRAVSLGVEVEPAQIVRGIDMDFFASVESKEFFRAKTENPDLVLEAGATMRLSNVSLLGFAPTATVSATRSISDLVIRDSMNLGVSVAIKSSF